jgi:hypothetical protein
MDVGMLWLDDDKNSSFEEKIAKAADYYLEKYGVSPEICLVNTISLKEEKVIGKIQVQPVANVLPHHFWMGTKSV